MKIIIAGGRDFKDWDMFQGYMSTLPPWISINEVVSGGATGADALGETWAKMMNIPCKVFNAEWERLGRKAGPMRNVEMSIYGDGLIAFWDGKSKGTAHMISVMIAAEKWTYVVRTDIPWDGKWTTDKDGKRLGPLLNNVEVYYANKGT
jgi:hypothetical protein